MSNAQVSLDWRHVVGSGDLCSGSRGFTVKPADAVVARGSPIVHLFLPPCNEVAFDVSGLAGKDDSLVYPLVVTWELLVGGPAVVDPTRRLWRKTTLLSSGASRVGRLFAYTGPVFRQALLVARLPASAVGGLTGDIEISAAYRQAIVGESVTVGSVVG